MLPRTDGAQIRLWELSVSVAKDLTRKVLQMLSIMGK